MKTSPWIWIATVALGAAVSAPAQAPDAEALERAVDMAREAAQAAPAAQQRPSRPAAAAARARAAEEAQQSVRGRIIYARHSDHNYQRGLRLLNDRKWEEASRTFTEVVNAGGERADGALYWKAYALHKLGRRADAQEALSSLKQKFSASRWLNDAKALEMELGRPVSPEGEQDEELKLLALNSLMHTGRGGSIDETRSIELLRNLLQGSQSPAIKERAMFLLTQSSSPKAREAIANIAKGGGNPDLQSKAIQYLGMFGGEESRKMLADIYTSSKDTETKRAVLRAYMTSGDRTRVLAAARSESSPELRREAIRQLGPMGGKAELWQMYQSERDAGLRREIMRGLAMAGDVDHILEIARSDKDRDLRREAVRNMAMFGKKLPSETILSLYEPNDAEIRKEVVRALFMRGDDAALVALARKESNPELKREIVHHLSMRRSKEATDYMLELLNK